ncbi:YdcF family protein [Eubacteriales bacterium OttesenSCG-928-N13]|nr:YdcF family protein [Eubacteriales bacterium OttesenSCG-928-N13]
MNSNLETPKIGAGRRILGIIKWVVLIGIALELLLMLTVFLVGRHAWTVTPTKSDAIIVLGARVNPNGMMSYTLRYRVQAAQALYEQGYAPYVIPCGGQGADEPRGEAEVMQEYLLQQGVPEASILSDRTSTSTEENLLNAMEIMKQHDLSTAIVVTSDYHLTRALWQARDLGLDASGAPARGPDSTFKFIEAHFRESVSWVNYCTGGLLKSLLFWR